MDNIKEQPMEKLKVDLIKYDVVFSKDKDGNIDLSVYQNKVYYMATLDLKQLKFLSEMVNSSIKILET